MRSGEIIQGRYALENPLGTGGMAEVWCARDQRMERSVAIKFLSPLLAEEAEFLVRFFSEAQTVAKINHPSVVAILDFGEHEDRPYLVMEYVGGGSLADLVGQPLLPETAFEMVAAAARGAGAAHEAGLVHRDVKPANILLDEHCGAKIADFGIASSRAAERLTATGAAIGSPHYISPEQVSASQVTPRSDVYSFGVVLFELLTGQKPFDAENVTAIAIAQVDQEPPVPSSINPDLPPAVDALLLRCLAKDPQERFADGNELAEVLENFDSSAAVRPAAGYAGDLNDDDDEYAVSANSRRVLVGTTLILLLFGLAAAGVVASNRSEPTVDGKPFAFESSTPTKPKEKSSPSPSPTLSSSTISSAPVVASSPSPSPSAEKPKEKKAEEPEDEKPSASPTPEPDPTPTEQPTEEPTQEPSAEPSPTAGEEPAP